MSPCVSLSSALTLPPHLSLFFSRSVVCPQVEYNSHLPRGVMNGRPLLKCLSITFECLLSLTSKRHTRWAHTHKQEHTHTRGSISVWTLCAGEVVFSLGAVGFFLIRTCSVFLVVCRTQQREKRSSRDSVTGYPAAPCSFGGGTLL